MASCQQQKFPPTPKQQNQNVTVCCKAYFNKCMGIEDGIVKLVDSVEQWEKLEHKAVISPVPVFALVKNGVALAHPDSVAPGEKVTLVPFEGVVQPCMLWSHAEIKGAVEFTPIFTAGNNNVEKILSLDVDQSTLEVVLQKSHVKQSQQWKISTVIPV